MRLARRTVIDTLLLKSIAAVTGRRLATIGAEAPLRQAARMLGATPVSLVIVCNPDGTMAGVLTKTDIVRALGRQPEAAGSLPAGEVMTRDVVFCRPEDTLAAQKLTNRFFLADDLERFVATRMAPRT